MKTAADKRDLSDEIAGDLPYLRRYARALTGSQTSGDQYAVATLETIITDPAVIETATSPKVGLFRTFHDIWASSGAVVDDTSPSDDLLEQRARWRLMGLSANSREALLLNTIEGFSAGDIAMILSTDVEEVNHLITVAREEIGKMVTGDVLIIEDEAIISMDLHSIVTDMGHTVTKIARTRDAAIKAGAEKKPDLILSDIQLADQSSGIDAVNALLEILGDVPVVFITAFPEKLLTGARPEPAFLITKPYAEEQVRAAVSQAMFFASTESLLATG
ncbi:two-component response regulator [Jannaschia sp. EhC01]|nr:two-component response regulator [Jannaschia sp. EhC01]